MTAVETRTKTAALVGRRVERRRIDRLLRSCRHGRGETLLLRGEAGIGKTALLGYAVARSDGMLLLSTQGVPSESALPFAGLSELLRPLLDGIGRLPEPQAAALEGALALGPPAAGDRFAVSIATLNLLALAAESEPLLLVVDDLHWLDSVSAETLLFALRRLQSEPVAALLALREGEPAPDVAGFGEVAVPGLDRDDALRLLTARTNGELVPAVKERLVATTAGNPLALIEIPTLLTDDQRSGRAPLEEPLPAGEGISRAYARRLSALSDPVRRALLVAAASDTSRIGTILYAFGELGLDPTVVEEAEAAGLVTIGDLRLTFRHPLLRSSVYASASAVERRSAHRALAAAHAASAEEDAAGRRAWHLSAAAVGPDATTAALLAQAGARARERHAYAEAARAYERAARLSTAPVDMAERLLAAAEASQLVNRTAEAATLLDEADRLATEPLLRTRVRHLRAKIETWRGAAKVAYELLVSDAQAIEAAAPEESAALRADAVLCAIVGGDIRKAVDCAQRAHELAAPLGGRAELVAALQLGKALILCGRSREGRPLALRAAELLEGEVLEHGDELSQCAPALMTVEEFALADRILAGVIGAAREANALGLMPYCLGALAELDYRLGRWSACYANASSSVELAREAGQLGQLSYNLARLARLEAATGRTEPGRTHAAEALELAERLRFGSTFPFAHAALGLLELGAGDPGAAVGHLEEARRWTDVVMGMFEPARVEWAPDLVEVYLRIGRDGAAAAEIAKLDQRASRSAGSWPEAVADRCRGLIADSDAYGDCFRRALAHHERAPMPFERARTELCYGERLRRDRRRAEARVPLRAALETFERLGAVPWTNRARAELTATGITVRSREIRFSDELTSQELQVALLVAKGATNKEAGAALFLTPKTIEFHLAKVYRKLGVRSRTELARWFAGEEGAVPSSPLGASQA